LQVGFAVFRTPIRKPAALPLAWVGQIVHNFCFPFAAFYCHHPKRFSSTLDNRTASIAVIITGVSESLLRVTCVANAARKWSATKKNCPLGLLVRLMQELEISNISNGVGLLCLDSDTPR
jgi:hypothetical protein